jgi:hypothetical protein
MSDIPEPLAEIERLNASFPHSPAIREWNKSGKKVIAFECTYVPRRDHLRCRCIVGQAGRRFSDIEL